MVAVRYATLAALVLWLGAMAGARFGDLVRRAEPVGFACGAAVLVGLIVMKLVGPPPRAFFVRAAVAALMIIIAAAAGVSRRADALAVASTVNLALGFALLFWYVRE
jgi:hypothetical protein